MSTAINKLINLHDRFFALVSLLRSPFLLLVRLYWGWQLIESGWGKLHNLGKVTEFLPA
jgi:putative oxidoreductase